MTIKKIKLKSNNICFGPRPEYYDEVEQHLSLSSSGEVEIIRYIYADGNKYKALEKTKIVIDKANAEKVLSLIDEFIKSDILVWASDVGVWTLTAVYDSGAKKEVHGSLTEGINCGETDISNYLRKYIPSENLFLFDGLQYGE